MRTPAPGVAAGLAVPAILICLGVLAIQDTTRMVDADSYVFPRAVAIALIVLCGLQVVVTLSGGSTSVPPARGSRPRRVGLVAAMLGATSLMPLIGFLPASLLAFGALTALAQHEAWSQTARLAYPLVGLALVLLMFWLFRVVLQVPLPSGPWV